ncbi:MFS transporter [Roseococcus pinisoli]|uniref:MFS transporter n=1 Tax=Roseococcus pinisoli TaxID=2835040 RepID=A0ABS5Q9M4_9PROT|nr:MFS transporter [Roseococcus pinisoli]MBS7810208.1 MFS transporter [Roseococcus pinisoli]
MPAPFSSLLGGAAGTHAADQVAMAALPLTVVLGLGAGAEMIGLLLAVQAAAWLLCSLPAGVLVDRVPRRAALLLSASLNLGGMGLAFAGSETGSLPLLGLGVFTASAGVVLYVLAAGSAVPDLVAREAMPRANARLELCRAVVTLLAAPAVGALAAIGWLHAAYGLAMGLAALGLAALTRLPRQGAAPRIDRPGLAAQLREGAGFVLGHPLLRGIGLCAIFWNMGFFAWMAGFVPFALQALALSPGQVGLVQGGYGAGLLAGAALAPICMRRLGPNAVLVIGPGVSVLAPVLLALSPVQGLALPLAAQFLVGFGPMMWLVCQVSIRQAVTPRAMLGRVGATLQVAIYGVRPIGALAGGWLAGMSPAWGIALAGTLFVASTAAVLGSKLVTLRAMPTAA